MPKQLQLSGRIAASDIGFSIDRPLSARVGLDEWSIRELAGRTAGQTVSETVTRTTTISTSWMSGGVTRTTSYTRTTSWITDVYNPNATARSRIAYSDLYGKSAYRRFPEIKTLRGPFFMGQDYGLAGYVTYNARRVISGTAMNRMTSWTASAEVSRTTSWITAVAMSRSTEYTTSVTTSITTSWLGIDPSVTTMVWDNNKPFDPIAYDSGLVGASPQGTTDFSVPASLTNSEMIGIFAVYGGWGYSQEVGTLYALDAGGNVIASFRESTDHVAGALSLAGGRKCFVVNNAGGSAQISAFPDMRRTYGVKYFEFHKVAGIKTFRLVGSYGGNNPTTFQYIRLMTRFDRNAIRASLDEYNRYFLIKSDGGPVTLTRTTSQTTSWTTIKTTNWTSQRSTSQTTSWITYWTTSKATNWITYPTTTVETIASRTTSWMATVPVTRTTYRSTAVAMTRSTSHTTTKSTSYLAVRYGAASLDLDSRYTTKLIDGVTIKDGLTSYNGGYWSGSRSYMTHIFNDDGTLLERKVFDVHGGSSAAVAMGNYLNSIPDGKAVLVLTFDEPQDNHLNATLLAAMERCGAGPLYSDGTMAPRSAYMLFGTTGVGAGGATEFYDANSVWATFDVIDQQFSDIRQYTGTMPYTYDVYVPEGVVGARVIQIGAGGAGSNGGYDNGDNGVAGFPGSYLDHYVDLTPGEKITVTVGKGAVGGSFGKGGDTTVTIRGVTYTAVGGTSAGSNNSPGSGSGAWYMSSGGTTSNSAVANSYYTTLTGIRSGGYSFPTASGINGSPGSYGGAGGGGAGRRDRNSSTNGFSGYGTGGAGGDGFVRIIMNTRSTSVTTTYTTSWTSYRTTGFATDWTTTKTTYVTTSWITTKTTSILKAQLEYNATYSGSWNIINSPLYGEISVGINTEGQPCETATHTIVALRGCSNGYSQTKTITYRLNAIRGGTYEALKIGYTYTQAAC